MKFVTSCYAFKGSILTTTTLSLSRSLVLSLFVEYRMVECLSPKPLRGLYRLAYGLK